MARRSRGPRGFIRPPKKTVMWIAGTTGTTVLSLGSGIKVLAEVLGAVALALRPFTVMRERGYFWTQVDNVAASEEPFGAMGTLVVTDSASAAGIASIPDPVSEPSASWVSYVPWIADAVVGSGVGFNSVARVFEYDSKAMRKVGIDDDFVMVIANDHATHGAEVSSRSRILIQLH